jgi:uncharacterized protein
MKQLLVSLFYVLITFATSAQDSFYERLSDAAVELAKQNVVYDPTYYRIDYPDGDIPPGKGVCTDVIIRTYRKLGIDLQKEVHEDMSQNFDKYPNIWGLRSPDTNIDHRRVPNLMTFFTRKGIVKKKSLNPGDYSPGDIVTWDLGRGLTHIGIVINKKTNDNKRYLILHNIGNGHEISDCLFTFKITGHYSYK